MGQPMALPCLPIESYFSSHQFLVTVSLRESLCYCETKPAAKIVLSFATTSPAIICLTETWLDDCIKACEVDFPNYCLFRRDRDWHGGGVAIYVLDTTIPVQ